MTARLIQVLAVVIHLEKFAVDVEEEEEYFADSKVCCEEAHPGED